MKLIEKHFGRKSAQLISDLAIIELAIQSMKNCGYSDSDMYHSALSTRKMIQEELIFLNKNPL